jgi:hypothetical protein
MSFPSPSISGQTSEKGRETQENKNKLKKQKDVQLLNLREYLPFGCGKKVGFSAHHSQVDTSDKERKMQKKALHPEA